MPELEKAEQDDQRLHAGPSSSFRPLFRNVAVVILVFCYLSFRTFSALKQSPVEDPNSYALCSPSGTAKIYTVDADNSVVECAYVNGERFADVGTLADIYEKHSGLLKPLNVRYIPEGAVVIPGMTDSHVHGLHYGLLKQLPLGGTTTVEETLKKVRAFVESDPDILNDKSFYIMGFGWDHTRWANGDRWPTSADMAQDDVLKDRRIALQSHDAHAFWVSPAVLASMDVPDHVEGGIIQRYPDGSPTGVFMDNARDIIGIPTPSDESLIKRWSYTVKDCWANGFTGVHDALLHPDTIDFFYEQAEKNAIGLRVYGMREFDLGTTGYWGNTSDKILNAGNDRFTVRSVKIVADGALRSGGAALYEPYADNPSSRGFFRVGPEILNEYIPRFIADGWQTNVHAIGDRTNGAVLDAFEKALKDIDVNGIRPRIEHAQIMKPSDSARLGKLGVISSVQLSHVTSDMWYAEDRLGDRVDTLYPFQSLLKSGSRMTLGSDFPVEEMSPFYGMYSGITRLSLDGTSPKGPDGFFPEQRISRLDALRGYTINPAYASFMEDVVGSIEKGKRADYVVLDRDLMKVSDREVADVKVLATVMDGEVVYGSL